MSNDTVETIERTELGEVRQYRDRFYAWRPGYSTVGGFDTVDEALERIEAHNEAHGPHAHA